MNISNSEGIYEALLLVQEEDKQSPMKADEPSSSGDESRLTNSSRSTIFGVALLCGIFLAAMAFAAAATSLDFRHDAPPPSDTEPYLLYYIIIKFAYAAHYIVCLSSVATLLVLLVTRSTERLALIRTILFQGGFFAGITMTFGLIQAILVLSSNQQQEYSELSAFVAPFVDPLAIVAVVNSCFFLREGKRGEGAPSTMNSVDDNGEEAITSSDVITEGNDEHYYTAMVV